MSKKFKKKYIFPPNDTYIDQNNYESYPWITKLFCLPKLPQNLLYLQLGDCNKLTSLRKLPNSLKKLTIYSCYNLVCLFPEKCGFPKNLTILECGYCPKLEKLTESKVNFPESLKELSLSSCVNLINIPDLPENLDYFLWDNCNKLSKISLSKKLKKFYVESDKDLVLPNFPSSLERLSICGPLKTIPKLSHLLDLNYFSCWNDSLEILPELPKNLKSCICSFEIKKKLYYEFQEEINDKNYERLNSFLTNIAFLRTNKSFLLFEKKLRSFQVEKSRLELDSYFYPVLREIILEYF